MKAKEVEDAMTVQSETGGQQGANGKAAKEAKEAKDAMTVQSETAGQQGANETANVAKASKKAKAKAKAAVKAKANDEEDDKMAYGCSTQHVKPERDDEVIQPKRQSRLVLPSVREVRGPSGPDEKARRAKAAAEEKAAKEAMKTKGKGNNSHAMNLPASLFIFAPEGTMNQKACSGEYILNKAMLPAMAWQHSKKADVFLRRIPGDFWIIGHLHGDEATNWQPLLCSWPCRCEQLEDIEESGSWNRSEDDEDMKNRVITAVTLSRHEWKVVQAYHDYEATTKKFPAEMLLAVTEGTEDQLGCSGEYRAVTFQGPEKCPVWQHSQWPLWLYKGTDERLYIGNEEERDIAFRCAQGFLRCEIADGPTASELRGQWERYDDDQDEWVSTTVIVRKSDQSAARTEPSQQVIV